MKNWLCLLLATLAAACSRPTPSVDAATKERPAPWSAAALAVAGEIPLQHEGREKPFATLAAFTLYAVHGRRDLQFTYGSREANYGGGDKVTLSPVEWLLDVLCFPEQASHYPLFRIENARVLDALFPDQRHAQRQDFDFLSYARLMRPATKGEAAPIQKLMQLVRELREAKDEKAMAPDELALVHLHGQFFTYHTVAQTVESLHLPYLLRGTELQALFDGAQRASYGQMLAKARPVAALAEQLRSKPEAERGTAVMIVDELVQLGQDDGGGGPALFPPEGPRSQEERWLRLGDFARLALAGQLSSNQQQLLGALERLANGDSMPAREAAVTDYRDRAAAAAGARGEFEKVQLEAQYYTLNLHYQALHWFLPGFLAVAASWLLLLGSRRAANIAGWLAFGLTTVGLGYLVGDIVLRCLITGRPPIKNLYDTFLFIAAVGVLTALVAELVTRLRVALAVAPFLGALLVMLARLFEVSDGSDTMKQLQAVLDSNYWLATHVTTINMGYAAGMLAMVIADVWLLLRAFGIAQQRVNFHKTIVRMVYGVTCFGLLFAVVGTILGGVWANDSWGRFWGWDPKENGALLICLAQVALLHGRMCGWFRDFAFCLLAGATGLWVAFSWFHVNLLGVGLHSYGFSSGLKAAVFTFYGIQGGILGLAALAEVVRRSLVAGAARPEDSGRSALPAGFAPEPGTAGK